ncbi:MAG: PEP/pyruvate-binding domain-containing protein, partial [Egibacteraceae bacterium]
MADALIVPLRELDRGAIEVAGGKAANLGELLRAGFPVPDGFCVTTAAYALAAEGISVDDAAAAREELMAAPIPAAVVEAVSEAYQGLGAGTKVAVRSSATAEDLPFASFAGQQDTFLNEAGTDEVLDATRRCWASLWTDRATAYRAANDVDPRSVRLAVVVQRMVDAAVAGVMFTANPLTGRRGQALTAKARAQLLMVGEDLTAAGCLAEAQDIWFLDLRDARRAVAGAHLRPLVRERRATYQAELRRRHVPRLL